MSDFSPSNLAHNGDIQRLFRNKSGVIYSKSQSNIFFYPGAFTVFTITAKTVYVKSTDRSPPILFVYYRVEKCNK